MPPANERCPANEDGAHVSNTARRCEPVKAASPCFRVYKSHPLRFIFLLPPVHAPAQHYFTRYTPISVQRPSSLILPHPGCSMCPIPVQPVLPHSTVRPVLKDKAKVACNSSLHAADRLFVAPPLPFCPALKSARRAERTTRKLCCG